MKKNYNYLFRSVVYGRDKYVAIDMYGSIFYSFNGLNWQKSKYPTLGNYKHIDFVNDLFVLSDKHSLERSVDSLERSIDSLERSIDCIYDDREKIAISADGIKFVKLINDFYIIKIINSFENQLAAISRTYNYSGIPSKRLLLLSKDSDLNFNTILDDRIGQIEDICYTKDNLVLVGHEFMAVLKRYDQRFVDFEKFNGLHFKKVVYNKNLKKFILYEEETNSIYHYDVEKSEIEKTAQLQEKVTDMVCFKNKIVATCENSIIYSEDGVDFFKATIFGKRHDNTNFYSITHGKYGFVAVGKNIIAHSYDGFIFEIVKEFDFNFKQKNTHPIS